MATIVLSAVGAGIGASVGGGVLGLSSVVIGRAVGAVAGRLIDNALMGEGSDPVEQGKVDRFRLMAAGEGAPVPRLFGRMRVGGQVIWSSGITEHVTVTDESAGGSGKGLFAAQSSTTTETYTYSMSLAVALCEGVITRVGRIWADGQEIAPDSLNIRVYTGTEGQMPDALIEADKGAGKAPAYRGTAYVVIEELDLTRFGNRVPVLNFEVYRPEQPGQEAEIARGTKAVAIIPGTGEYALATTSVHVGTLPGVHRPVNENTPLGKSDFAVSLDMLDGELPNLEATSLVVCWFGNDLRCGHCDVAPKVEQYTEEGQEMAWSVSGLARVGAGQVPLENGRPVYGGTPTDASVVEAIAALNGAGKAVTFYPFILMTQQAGNTLTDPYSGGAGQAVLPWRGRITLSRAPGVDGSPDGTAAAAAEVASFFGSAQPSDFTVSGTEVSYSGPAEWSYRRFILHYAHLCAAAGGVEAFLIGSELRGLTWLRGAGNSFPAVAELVRLAADVRSILGPGTKISYAADWSEYFGYQPGGGDLFYHLDPLWADANIDFIGIDNYMPLSDWRDGWDHKDAASWGSIYDLDYLRSNILGGEGYDWYYHAPEAREVQLRTPITDGAYGKDWVWRYKDLPNWWRNEHKGRAGGYELDDLPLNLAGTFCGTFSGGAAYWLASFTQSEAQIPSAVSFTDAYAEATVETVPGEGNVLQVASAYKVMSERAWRPFIDGQQVEVTIRTRLLAEPTDGNPHRFYMWITALAADGSYAGYTTIGYHTGLAVGDGWQEITFAFSPGDKRSTGGVPADAKGWRLMIGVNGWTPYDPAGAIQQISRISVTAADGVSAWVPGSKPIRFTELGCAALDKATNQPNKFLDPKSSESSLPRYSNGVRDDFIQMQYLRAHYAFWADPANNPTDAESGVQMLDMSRAHVWAWDARPFPWFPARDDLWGDAANYHRGHWMNGRASNRSLASVVKEIGPRSGVKAGLLDTAALYGLVRGYEVSQVIGARGALQPLMLAYGFEAAEREGKLRFFSRSGLSDGTIDPDTLAMTSDLDGSIQLARAPESDLAGRVRLNFVQAAGHYDVRATEAVFGDEETHAVSTSELPLVLLKSEARGIVERWLAEARVARDRAAFALPPSQLGTMAGDVVEIDLPSGVTKFRVDHVEQDGVQMVRAVRVEPRLYLPVDAADESAEARGFRPAVPVTPYFLDLPLLTGDEKPWIPHLAVAGVPWPGTVAVYMAPSDNGYKLNRLVPAPARVGLSETVLGAARPGVIDNGPALRVRLPQGTLASATIGSVLNGVNAAAIGDGTPDNWEIFQFTTATLVDEDLWEITGRLRGQAGSDALMPEAWPVGSLVVFLDATVNQIGLAAAARGLERHFRVGPAARPLGDPTYSHSVYSFAGNGLRPYAPVHLAAERQAGGGLAVSWIRRTRKDGDSWASVEVPLNEESEAYSVRVRQGATVLREVSVSGPGWTYSAAHQASDGVAMPFVVEVAQVSQSYGAGPYRQMTVEA